MLIGALRTGWNSRHGLPLPLLALYAASPVPVALSVSLPHRTRPSRPPAHTASPQNLDRLLRTHATDHFRKLEALLAALPPRCLLFGGYCSRSLARAEAKGREGGPPGLSRFFSGLGGAGGDSGLGGLGDEAGSLLDRFGRGGGAGAGRQRKSTKGKVGGLSVRAGD